MRAFPRQLLIGDVLAAAAFVVVGQIFHNTLAAPDAAQRAILQIASIGAPFALLAWALGAYPARAPVTRADVGLFLWRSLLAWLFAVPAGLFLRAWLLGQPTVLMAFVGPALASSAPFVLGWRLIYALSAALVHGGKVERSRRHNSRHERASAGAA